MYDGGRCGRTAEVPHRPDASQGADGLRTIQPPSATTVTSARRGWSPALARVGEELVAWFKTLVSAAVYATLIVTFGFQVARVEGQSMVPTLEDRGWRANAGAKATLGTRFSIETSYGLEHGPGASGRFVDGYLTLTPDSRYAFDQYGGTMARPIELR